MPRKNVRCAVKDCPSITGVDAQEKRMFCFPKQRETCQKWVDFCQNPDVHNKFLSGSLASTTYVRICSLHFTRDKFSNELRIKLLRGAVPDVLKPANVRSAADNAASSSTPITHSSSSTTDLSHLPLLSPIHSVVPSLHTPHTPINSRSLLPLIIEADNSATSTPSSPSPFSPLTSSPVALSLSNQKDLSLSHLNLTRYNQPTQRKMKQFKCAKKKERKLKRLQSLVWNLKSLLKATSSSKGSLSQVKDIINSSILGSKLKSAGKKPKGRRWTLDEKLLALAMYKKSPKAYHLLRCLFTVPSRSSINKFLHSIQFSPGINPQIFASLSHSLSQMEDCDRICVLMFDEMSILEHCEYNASLDLIVGFEDYGCNRRSKLLAKYALVFMVCGVLRKWKQPIAFYFSASQTKSEVIVSLMEEVLQQCHEAGLHVLATVCDMGTNNVKALCSMGSSISHPYINFKEQTIFTIFNPPHLIKGTRNLLMAHDFAIPIKLIESNILGMPSWNHIQDAYKHAAEATLYRPIHRITEEHVNPKGRSKMKVNLATQIFSRSLAAYVEEGTRSKWLPEGALSTAWFLGFMDELFDSMNADGKGTAYKPLKNVVTAGSPHFQFWERAAISMKDWQIVKEQNIDIINLCPMPPSQKGWLTNLSAFPQICREIFQMVHADTKVSTRSFNKDPLENLLGSIRGNCGSNTHPTATQFIECLKSSIFSGLAFSASTAHQNCEEDGMALLDSLRALIGASGEVESVLEEDITSPFSGFVETETSERNAVEILAPVCSRLFPMIDSCELCKAALMNGDSSPSKNLVKVILQGCQATRMILDAEADRTSLQKSIVQELESVLCFQWMEKKCLPHWRDLKKSIIKLCVNRAISRWCQERRSR